MNRTLGFLLVSGLAIAVPEACSHTGTGAAAETTSPEAVELVDRLEHARMSARAQAAALAAEHVAPPEPEPWTPPAEPVLAGLEGAGQQLALSRPELALEQLAGAGAAEPGTREWFVAAAIAGRANRGLGRHAAAVEALTPAWEHEKLAKRHIAQLMGQELALAHIEWARSGTLSTEEADAHLETAMNVLGKAMRQKPLRWQAPMRVLYSQAAAQVRGSDEKSSHWAAVKAVRSLDRTLRDLPNHPERAALELARARAKVRSNKVTEAAEELRRIAIDHAGAPEAEQAWSDLEALAAEHTKVHARAFSGAEQLLRAQNARSGRWMDESRRILDELIGDPATADHIRRQARRQRGYTAYRERDYDTCIRDLQPAWERTKSLQLRDELSRCLERGAHYTEVIELWLEIAEGKGKKTGARANALWTAIDLAVRGGKYDTAKQVLARYEETFRAHAEERRWLHAWLPYRLGDDEAALEAFAELERRSDRYRTTARYYRGKLLLRSEDPELRTQGAVALRELNAQQPLSYYGLMARQRLLDAQADPGPVDPDLHPIPEEDQYLGYSAARRVFESLLEQFPDASSALARADVLHASGWMEEARRELRVADDEFLNGEARIDGRSITSPRNEDIVVGLGWKSEWTYPKVMPGKSMRKVIRGAESSEKMREGLWKLSHALQEPHRLAKLSPRGHDYKARWHPRAYRDVIEREAVARKIDPTHLWALMYTESRFRRHVVSPVGARGALQIMPWTGRQLQERLGTFDGNFNPDVLFEVETNSALAAYYVSELMHKFHGQAAMAYGSYNGGPSNVARWLAAKAQSTRPLELDDFIEEIPFTETHRYVKRVMEVQAAYALMYRGELPRWESRVDPEFEDNIDF